MQNDAIEYRTAPPPKLRHSMLGVAAFIISLFVPALLLLGPYYFSVLNDPGTSRWLSGRMVRLWPMIVSSIYLLFPIGLIAGVLGVMRRGYKRRLAVVACIINGGVMLMLFTWLIGVWA